MNNDLMKVVFTTVSSMDNAKKLSLNLIENKLAACVNVIPNIVSFYEWEGKINQTPEYLLVIKIFANKYDILEKYIKSVHEYELPEIIAFNLTDTLPEYLAWAISNR